jgi:2-polyprenyl-6-methoxyphenol hydroxylase-like FAD-dependent oxidoreductase
MHIAIIGGGISGLSLYLWLQKLGLTSVHPVTIYEARSATPVTTEDDSNDQTSNASFIGGALGLSPIGLRVLRRLDAELEQEILRTGHWMGRWRLSNARGWFLGETQVAENGGGVLVGRAAFWQCLRRRVPDAAIVGHKKVVEVLPGDARQGSRCKIVFKDEGRIEADLVAGCDGVWSMARTAVLGEEVKPIYQGLTGVGGFVNSDKLVGVEDGEMNVVFGANGFFGYGYSSSEANDPQKHGNEAAWWSTYSLAECPIDWRNIDRDDAKRQLAERHGSWRNTVVQRIIEKVEVDSVYPTFTTPDLATWENGCCVLLGDAAHALQPSVSTLMSNRAHT